MSSPWHRSVKDWPFLACNRSSSSRRLGSASALNTVSISFAGIYYSRLQLGRSVSACRSLCRCIPAGQPGPKLKGVGRCREYFETRFTEASRPPPVFLPEPLALFDRIRPFRERPIVIALGSDRQSEGAAEVTVRCQAV